MSDEKEGGKPEEQVAPSGTRGPSVSLWAPDGHRFQALDAKAVLVVTKHTEDKGQVAYSASMSELVEMFGSLSGWLLRSGVRPLALAAALDAAFQAQRALDEARAREEAAVRMSRLPPEEGSPFN